MCAPDHPYEGMDTQYVVVEHNIGLMRDKWFTTPP